MPSRPVALFLTYRIAFLIYLSSILTYISLLGKVLNYETLKWVFNQLSIVLITSF